MKHYKFKNSVKLLINSSKDELHIIFLNEHKELVIEVDQISLKLVELIGDSCDLDNIYKTLTNEYPKLTIPEIQEHIDFLEELNVIERVSGHSQTNIDTDFLCRQVNFFGDFSSSKLNEFHVQEILSNSHVAIVGVGAIGSWIAYNLVQSGIENMTIIDPDVISISNLSRQALYFRDDIGNYKVDVLANRLRSINPNAKITKRKEYINESNDLVCISENVDLVINCSDQPNAYTTGMIISKYCIEKNVPHINGIGYRGNICRLGTTTIPHKTMCWSCIHQNKDWDLGKLTELKFDKHTPAAGSISSLTSLIASIHSWEAIKVLSPIFSPILINKSGELDFNNLTINWYEEKQKVDCNICSRKITEVTV
ncbi:ThiF family adenylyltransferase [Bacillus sp. Marseille-Q3570]|uniref:HesA/MoeB/ThiF family protein n=1 Tax=Bacillus sp. Marseille-Q3570 TaxID=2963522 RepID=UPI0021B6FC50|nr:ThiF family adenylyltransferase [Bacillus sp. Marseille-Q3570]